jgi:HEAT repeat protein
VLAANKSEASNSILRDLYGRQADLVRLVGAIGLAAHGLYREPINADNYLVQMAQKKADLKEDERVLAIIALGKMKNSDAVPFLTSLLESADYWRVAGEICRSLASIGSRDAIPALEKYIRIPRESWDVSAAFRALISLGDKESMRTAIYELEREHSQSKALTREIKRVTGQNFGQDDEKWRNWWSKNSETWAIPEKFMVPNDEQEHEAASTAEGVRDWSYIVGLVMIGFDLPDATRMLNSGR